MQRTNIYLEDRQTRELDRLAQAEGVSRAEMLRRILDRGLGGVPETLASDLAAIDLSFGCLAEVTIDLPDRRADARAEHLARAWGRS